MKLAMRPDQEDEDGTESEVQLTQLPQCMSACLPANGGGPPSLPPWEDRHYART